MKKAFLLAGILFISVISTACINNFAIRELNNKAKEFMDKGDYASAIERLKSGVDLDATVFETQYNLAVAYTQAEDYDNAVKTYKEVIKLNPDFADSYYSLAVCEENLAKDIISQKIEVNEDGSMQKAEEDDQKDKTLSDKAKDIITELLNDSIANYKLYSEKSSEDGIDEKIKELETLLEQNGNNSSISE